MKRSRAGLVARITWIFACLSASSLIGWTELAEPGLGLSAESLALPEFTRQDVIPAPGVDFVRGADLDGDGRIDFVGLDTVYDRGTGNPIELQLTWWRQEAPAEGEPAGFDFDEQTAPRGAPRDLDLLLGVGDLDADGHQDLVTVDPSSQVSAWLNEDGSAEFAQRRSGGRVLSDVSYLEVANLDVDSGDLHDDLLVIREGRDLTWYPTSGSAGQIDLGPAVTLLRGTDARQLVAVATGDLDGDGLLDLATATDKTGDKIAWWRQRIEGEERVFEKLGEGDEDDVRDLTTVDIDGDGDLDILVTSQIGNQPYKVFAWLNDGSGGGFEREPTALHQSQNSNHKWNSIDAGDVNADGAMDFITSEHTENATGGRLCWYENPGAPVPTVEPTAQPTSEPTETATAEPTNGATPTASATPGGDPSPTAGSPEPSPSRPTMTPTPLILKDWWLYLPLLMRQ